MLHVGTIPLLAGLIGCVGWVAWQLGLWAWFRRPGFGKGPRWWHSKLYKCDPKIIGACPPMDGSHLVRPISVGAAAVRVGVERATVSAFGWIDDWLRAGGTLDDCRKLKDGEGRYLWQPGNALDLEIRRRTLVPVLDPSGGFGRVDSVQQFCGRCGRRVGVDGRIEGPPVIAAAASGCAVCGRGVIRSNVSPGVGLLWKPREHIPPPDYDGYGEW